MQYFPLSHADCHTYVRVKPALNLPKKKFSSTFIRWLISVRQGITGYAWLGSREIHKLKCSLKVGERMIIFWQHFFIVIVEASSSPYSLSSPHVSLFSTLFIRAHVCEKLLWCPYCTLCPCPTVHNFVFLQRGTPAVSARKKHYLPFAALKSRVIIVLAAHTESLFGSSIPSLCKYITDFYYQPVSSQPAAEYHCNVDKNYSFLSQSFHEVYKWTTLPPFP